MGKTAGGRRDRRHVVGTTRNEVVNKVRALERKRDAGVALAAGRTPTVAEWMDFYLIEIAARKVRPSTLTRYRSLVEHQIKPKLGHHRLDRLQPEHVERAWGELLDSGLSASSVLQAHRVLSRSLKIATRRGRVARNVCTLIDPPSVHRSEITPLTQEEARKIIKTASGRHNAARWSVALALGLRQGEALGLAWDDIDLDKGTLTVRQALQRLPYQHRCTTPCGEARAARCPERTAGGLVLVPPKSRAGRRTIALPQPLVDALKTHRSAQAAERLAAGADWVNSGLVFTQPNGKPIDPASDYRQWHALLEDAGVRRARLHDARHTAATIMLTMGVPARVAMEILGHSQISLTLGTYSHVVPELAQDAANRVGTALWGS
jgi:integrase